MGVEEGINLNAHELEEDKAEESEEDEEEKIICKHKEFGRPMIPLLLLLFCVRLLQLLQPRHRCISSLSLLSLPLSLNCKQNSSFVWA